MKFALAGNPNSGKTTLFNNLTGSTARVGNYPGVTVEKRFGVYKKLDQKVEIVDLPGIYSLSPYTPEEVVSRDFILSEKPDCIINIVDATNLERNLYLTTQVLETDIPVVVALNFMDILDKSGDTIDVDGLSKQLNCPVVKISALKRKGLNELMNVANSAAKKGRKGYTVLCNDKFMPLINEVESLYKEKNVDNALFHAIKLIEGDQLEKEKEIVNLPNLEENKLAYIDPLFGNDFEAVVADARYKHISTYFSPLLCKKQADIVNDKVVLSKSDKIDRILTNKYLGIPLFLFFMLAIFHIVFSENFLFLSWVFNVAKVTEVPENIEKYLATTGGIYSPGVIIHKTVESLWGMLTEAIAKPLPEGTWYTGLLVDGLLEGLGAILSFIPLILLLFVFLSILEDTGYMARVAFILDRAFRRFGLSGRAFLPLLTCFGCAIPGIMGTRVLEDKAERKRAILLTPFFSCGAKLPIWAAFGGVFALKGTGINSVGVVFGVYLIGIVVAILGSLFLKKTVIKGDTPPFIMELPAYRMPQFRTVMAHLWDKLKHYLVKAGTIIAGSIIVIWFLTNFNFQFQMVEKEESIAAILSKGLTYLFVPLGWGFGENGWKFTVAAFTGLIAKEMVIGTMGIFADAENLGDEAFDKDPEELAGNNAMSALIIGIGGQMLGVNTAIPAMFAFLIFNLLSVPCMAAVASAYGEFVKSDGKKKGRKLTLFAVGFWLVTAYVVALLVFWIGMMIAQINWWTLLLVLAIALIAYVVFYIKRKNKKKINTKECAVDTKEE